MKHGGTEDEPEVAFSLLRHYRTFGGFPRVRILDVRRLCSLSAIVDDDWRSITADVGLPRGFRAVELEDSVGSRV